MPVPDFQSLMRPVLEAMMNGREMSVAAVCEQVARAESLTPEDLSERTRGGGATKFKDRVSWGITYMMHAGLVKRVRRAVYRITPRGKDLLSRKPARIDKKLLNEYPAYVEWKNRKQGQTSIAERPALTSAEAVTMPRRHVAVAA